MSRPRHLAAIALGVVACAGSVGLVLAQDFPGPPPPPGYIPGVGQPPPGVEPGPGPGRPAGPPVVLSQDAAPPDEAEPPPQISAEANEATQPLPGPDAGKKGEPMKRPRFTSAILQAVDKTTAETLRFEAKVGEPIRYKGLVVTVHACEGTAPDEGFTDSMVHLDVQAQPEAIAPQASRVIFRGWMFASSPGLHAVEHPLYDVWLIACKTAAPPAAGVNL